MTVDPRLPGLFAAVTACDLQGALGLLKAVVDQGSGTWIDPDASHPVADGMARPASHQHEIIIFGVSGYGYAPDEATEHWIRSARQQLKAAKDEAAA